MRVFNRANSSYSNPKQLIKKYIWPLWLIVFLIWGCSYIPPKPKPNPPDWVLRLQGIKQPAEEGKAISSKAAQGLYLAGMDFFQQGSYRRAVEKFHAAIEQDQEFPASYIMLGEIYSYTKRLDMAEVNYQQALELDSSLVEAWLGLGILYWNKGKYELAHEQLTTALKLQPQHLRVQYYLKLTRQKLAQQNLAQGIALWNSHQWEQAIMKFELAIQFDPQLEKAYLELAHIYIDQQEYESAVGKLQQALKIMPEAALCWQHLGQVYLRLDEYDLARDSWQRSLSLNPANQEVKKLLKLVQQELVQREAVRKKPVSKQKPQAEPQITAALTTGRLSIITNPSKAKIIFVGHDFGYTPKTIPDLEAGAYEIKLVKQDFREWSGQAEVVVGTEKQLNVDLMAHSGMLNINANPAGATILIGNKSRGETDKTLALSPGSYTVKLVKQGFNSISRRIKIVDGRSTKLNLILTKKGIPQVPGMTYITEGEFIMGAKNGEEDERPVHRVYVTGFYIDKNELNNKEYHKFIAATGRRAPNFRTDADLNKPELPVVGVTWHDAEAYCKWVGKRLPTEAEWEKAARGIDGRKYPWGNNYSNQHANSYGERDGFQFAAPTNHFSSGASPFGVLNMAGNVWEWCTDRYAENSYAQIKPDTTQGLALGQLRIIRGGSWEDTAFKLRTTNRHATEPGYSTYNLGFRCAKEDYYQK